MGALTAPPNRSMKVLRNYFPLSAMSEPTVAWQSNGVQRAVYATVTILRLRGVPVIDTMGVRGGAIHSSDEFMIIDSLAERAALSAVTIMRIIEKGGL